MEKRPPPLCFGGGKVSQLGDVKGGAPETSPRSTGLLIPPGLSGRYKTKSNNIMCHVLPGMGLMLAFGIGTVPSFLLVGKLAGLRWIKSRHLIYKISSVLMVLVGIYIIIQGIRY